MTSWWGKELSKSYLEWSEMKLELKAENLKINVYIPSLFTLVVAINHLYLSSRPLSNTNLANETVHKKLYAFDFPSGLGL